MDTMIELPALRRSAELAPNTVDADARTVEVIWSAGARVRRASFFGEPLTANLPVPAWNASRSDSNSAFSGKKSESNVFDAARR